VDFFRQKKNFCIQAAGLDRRFRMDSNFNQMSMEIRPKDWPAPKRQKIAAFLAKTLKLRPALPNHDHDTPILVGYTCCAKRQFCQRGCLD
jgi:hypothetical protein